MKTRWTYAAALTLSFAASANEQTALPAKNTNAAFVQCALKEIRESGFSTHWTKANIRRGRIGFDDHYTSGEQVDGKTGEGKLYERAFIVKGAINHKGIFLWVDAQPAHEKNTYNRLNFSSGYRFSVSGNFKMDSSPTIGPAKYTTGNSNLMERRSFEQSNRLYSTLALNIKSCAFH